MFKLTWRLAATVRHIAFASALALVLLPCRMGQAQQVPATSVQPGQPASATVPRDSDVPRREERPGPQGLGPEASTGVPDLTPGPSAPPLVTAATTSERPPPRPEESGSFVRTWWFWTTLGVLLAGGGAAAAIIAVEASRRPPYAGTLPPGTIEVR